MNVTTPQAPTFTRPLPPEPDIQRDAEMLDLYFDPTRTTREIAEHFKLSVVVVVAWFQRPDIAAIIDYVTAASERRARDIVRENLPGTINVLQRISIVRNDDKISRAAASALLTFARGRALPRSADRSRTANASPPRDTQSPETPTQPPRTHETPVPSRDDDTCAAIEIAQTPGRSPDVPRTMTPALPSVASDDLHPGESAPEPLALHSSRPHGVAC